MALSLLVLIIPLLVVVAAYRYLYRGEEAVVVDTAPAVEQATRAGRMPIVQPAGLADGWRPISAVYREVAEGATLRIGYLTPSGAGVGLIQSTLPADTLFPAELGEAARPSGNETIAGRTWQRYAARDGETAIVLRQSDRTVIVNGRASVDELRTLVASLG